MSKEPRNSKKAVIYKIVNKTNNKIYVGSTAFVEKRFARHKSDLKCNRHYNKHMQSSWNLNGPESFEFEIIETIIVFTKELILEREQYWIDLLKPEYNKRVMATSNLGMKMPRQSILNSKRTKYSWEIAKKLRDEFHSTDINQRELAIKYEMSLKYLKAIIANQVWVDEDYVPRLTSQQFKNKIIGRKKVHSESTKINRAQISSIFEQYNSGISKKEIADNFNLSRVVVGRIFRGLSFLSNEWLVKNCPTNTSFEDFKNSFTIKPQISRLSNEDIKEIFKLRQDGLSKENISKKFKVNEKVIRKILDVESNKDFSVNVPIYKVTGEV